MMRVSFFFAWFDFWIGFFYHQDKRVLYICPLPCCVIKVQFKATKLAGRDCVVEFDGVDLVTGERGGNAKA